MLVAAPQVNIHIGNKGDFDMIQLCCYENNPMYDSLVVQFFLVNSSMTLTITIVIISITGSNIIIDRLIMILILLTFQHTDKVLLRD